MTQSVDISGADLALAPTLAILEWARAPAPGARPLSVLILPHERPDGDALGSALGLAELLFRLGFTDVTVSTSKTPPSLDYLPGSSVVREPPPKPRLVIALDAADRARLGRYEAIFAAAEHTLLIDHHPHDPTTNPPFAKVNLVDATAASTTEIIYRLVMIYARRHQGMGSFGMASFADPATVTASDVRIATWLLAGAAHDTFGLTKRTTETTLLMAAALADRGAPVAQIIFRATAASTVPRARLRGLALSNLEHNEDRTIVWTHVSRRMIAQTGVSGTRDGDDIPDFLMRIAKVLVAIVLFHEPDGSVRFSLRAPFGEHNLLKVAEALKQKFNPPGQNFVDAGGHSHMVGGKFSAALFPLIRAPLGASARGIQPEGDLEDFADFAERQLVADVTQLIATSTRVVGWAGGGAGEVASRLESSASNDVAAVTNLVQREMSAAGKGEGEALAQEWFNWLHDVTDRFVHAGGHAFRLAANLVGLGATPDVAALRLAAPSTMHAIVEGWALTALRDAGGGVLVWTRVPGWATEWATDEIQVPWEMVEDLASRMIVETTRVAVVFFNAPRPGAGRSGVRVHVSVHVAPGENLQRLVAAIAPDFESRNGTAHFVRAGKSVEDVMATVTDHLAAVLDVEMHPISTMAWRQGVFEVSL